MQEFSSKTQPIGQLVPVSEITNDHRDKMFVLMNRYYKNMARTTFDVDLSEKQWVIQIVDSASNELLGFSSQVLMDVPVGGRTIRALFSGDTIVKSDLRGLQLFQVSGWLVRKLMDAYPHNELYWFLISKGYKTYRFLPLFFREFYPRLNTKTPPECAQVISALALHIASSRYDPLRGILRAGPGACRLLPGVADVTSRRLRDPHVQFFVNANPGHADGDELCCIAPLTPHNLTPAAYRAMGTQSPFDSLVL